MDLSFLISLGIVLALVVVIMLIGLAFKRNSKVKDITTTVAEYVPTIIDLIEKVTVISKPENEINIEKVKKVAEMAVKAVEQIATTTELFSTEKKELAIEYYKILAKELGIPELTELQEETIDVIIENVVLEINRRIDK